MTGHCTEAQVDCYFAFCPCPDLTTFVTGNADFSRTSDRPYLSAALPFTRSQHIGLRAAAPCLPCGLPTLSRATTLPPLTGYVPDFCPGEVVPARRSPASCPGLNTYVRIFHPVGALAPAEFVTWQEVADWSGGIFHPLAQFERMSIPVRPQSWTTAV